MTEEEKRIAFPDDDDAGQPYDDDGPMETEVFGFIVEELQDAIRRGLTGDLKENMALVLKAKEYIIVLSTKLHTEMREANRKAGETPPGKKLPPDKYFD